MSGFAGRENQLFDVLERLNEHDLEYVVIGGLAVAAFSYRFSVDVDIVVSAPSEEQIADQLSALGFEQTVNRDLDEHRFRSFEIHGELPVTVDLMVGGVSTRQTGATWGYEELAKEAQQETIYGSERTVRITIPEPELLVAMKLHSGRQTDARDVVALAESVDFRAVEDYLYRGDRDALRDSLIRVREIINRDGFEDAFKGVFSTGDRPVALIEVVGEFLDSQLDALEE